MKTRNNKLLTLMFLFIVKPGFAQNDFISVKLEISHSLRIPYNLVNINLFKRDTIFFIEVKSLPYKNDDKKHSESVIDTTYSIKKDEFYYVIELVRELSPQEIFQKIDIKETWIGVDGLSCKLEYGTWQNNLSLLIWNPSYKTEERNLNQFLKVCKQIIFLGKLNPEKVL